MSFIKKKLFFLHHLIRTNERRSDIWSKRHNINLPFCLFTGFLNVVCCAILLTCHNVKFAILSSCHFVNLPFCQLAILSSCHFVNLPICQHAILSTCHSVRGHFVNLPFCQLTTMSNLPFC
jgi:hypothetical protein